MEDSEVKLRKKTAEICRKRGQAHTFALAQTQSTFEAQVEEQQEEEAEEDNPILVSLLYLYIYCKCNMPKLYCGNPFFSFPLPHFRHRPPPGVALFWVRVASLDTWLFIQVPCDETW